MQYERLLSDAVLELMTQLMKENMLLMGFVKKTMQNQCLLLMVDLKLMIAMNIEGWTFQKMTVLVLVRRDFEKRPSSTRELVMSSAMYWLVHDKLLWGFVKKSLQLMIQLMMEDWLLGSLMMKIFQLMMENLMLMGPVRKIPQLVTQLMMDFVKKIL